MVDLKGVRELEDGYFQSKKNANNVVDLIEVCETESDEVVYGALHSLHRIFTQANEKGELKKVSGKEKKEAAEENGKGSKKLQFMSWFHDRYLDFLKTLLKMFGHPEPTLQLAALKISMDMVWQKSQLLKKQGAKQQFANSLYERVVESVLFVENESPELYGKFVEYLREYKDLQYFFWKDCAKVSMGVSDGSMATVKTWVITTNEEGAENSGAMDIKAKSVQTKSVKTSKKIFSLLKQCSMKDMGGRLFLEASSEFDSKMGAGKKRRFDEMMESDDDIENSNSELLSDVVLKRAFSDCWLGFLRLPLDTNLYKLILLNIHTHVLPFLNKPNHLMDFLTDSYDVGGVVSLLALNGLFILITKHNLDYPDFFDKLYKLLTPDIMYMKHRARFFHLLDMFLTSTHLSSYVVASFIKKLIRISLSSPPQGVFIIIPFVYNLLKRHTSCMFLIHNASAENEQDTSDPFDPDATELSKTYALQSTLWELKALKRHYHPEISRFVNIFESHFTKQEFPINDFLEHSYESIFTTEIDRRPKEVPLAFKCPNSMWGLTGISRR
eukprot:Nk52_evm21s238 gene=Nk52_evmTU21s238